MLTICDRGPAADLQEAGAFARRGIEHAGCARVHLGVSGARRRFCGGAAAGCRSSISVSRMIRQAPRRRSRHSAPTRGCFRAMDRCSAAPALGERLRRGQPFVAQWRAMNRLASTPISMGRSRGGAAGSRTFGNTGLAEAAVAGTGRGRLVARSGESTCTERCPPRRSNRRSEHAGSQPERRGQTASSSRKSVPRSAS
jgi:hypothetical protein